MTPERVAANRLAILTLFLAAYALGKLQGARDAERLFVQGVSFGAGTREP